MRVSTKTGGQRTAIVLDSWAILAYMQDEAGAPQVEALILRAVDAGLGCFMSTINLGEIWYITARRISDEEADRVVEAVLAWGIQRVAPDWPMVRQAAMYKSRHKLSYADGFAAALALARDARLVTGDPEFKPLENEIRIHWLSR